MFVIMHKETKKFFAGFDSQKEPVWVSDKSKAQKDRLLATSCQTSLLRCHGINVQQKPVAE